jgi:acyl carrier protein
MCEINEKSMEILKKVKGIICDSLVLESVENNATQEMYSEWDSLAYMGIISKLEEEFEIQISEDNINHFDSISNIIRIIERAAS